MPGILPRMMTRQWTSEIVTRQQSNSRSRRSLHCSHCGVSFVLIFYLLPNHCLSRFPTHLDLHNHLGLSTPLLSCTWCTGEGCHSSLSFSGRGSSVEAQFFFHEYGRRVGMVPRSSLKEGKNSQMVEKITRTTQQQKPTANHSPKAKSPPSCGLSSVLR